MLTGSLGMLPSASLGEIDAKTKKRRSLFEPVHGSAPDIAGKGLANPIAMISSFGMALRYSFDMGALADKVDAAIAAVLASGLAHRGYQVRRHDGCQHDADGRSDPEGIAEAARVSAQPTCRPGLRRRNHNRSWSAKSSTGVVKSRGRGDGSRLRRTTDRHAKSIERDPAAIHPNPTAG